MIRRVAGRLRRLARRLDDRFDPGRFTRGRPVRGVLFIGYVEAALGLGESLRGLIRAVEGRMPFAIEPFNAGVEGRRAGPFMAERYDRRRAYAVNVIEVATDQLPHVRHAVRRRRLATSVNVLRTYWELAAAPPDWAPLLDGIDEVWAPTRFVAEAMKAVFAGLVVTVPPCVDVARARAWTKAELGLAEGRFHVLFSFDYQSSTARKNPLGVLEAFVAAFPDPAAPATLLVKSTGLPEAALVTPEQAAVHAALTKAATGGRVRMIDRIMTRDEMLGLIACSDCYVSLHRSEGFGLGMAEAMALGTPVIGTDYSGSQDFLSAATGFPVPCTLRPVAEGEYAGWAGQVWAEPDEAAAAAALRAVFAGGDEVVRRVAAARSLVRTRYGVEAVGDVAVARLEELIRRAPTRVGPDPSPASGEGVAAG